MPLLDLFRYSNKLLRKASAAINRNDPNEALIFAQEAYEINPKNFLVYILFGAANIRKGNFVQGIIDIREGLDLIPDHNRQALGLAYGWLATAHASTGNYQAARQDTEKSLLSLPLKNLERATIYLQQSIISYHQGDLDQALIDVEKALAFLNGRDIYSNRLMFIAVSGWATRSHIFSLEGKSKQALAEAARALSRAERLTSDAQMVAYGARALAHNSGGNYKNALLDCETALRLGRQRETGLSTRLSLHCLVGNIRDVQNDQANALEQYNEAIRLSPEYSRAYVLRSQLYVKQGDSSNAEQDLETARQLAIDPPQPTEKRYLTPPSHLDRLVWPL